MDHTIRVRNCLPPCSQGSPMNACMVLSNWTSPSGCSESRERITPMQTSHDYRRMAMIYLCEVQRNTLPRLCDIRPDVTLRV
ncbi:hypothetical protein M405DRAFT_833741 [Rhizopogon salebrosus TDB-379]|nr:hypothetical protein M405DRAFT_833741 [Rhizopogon salebrosus TDB-379]